MCPCRSLDYRWRLWEPFVFLYPYCGTDGPFKHILISSFLSLVPPRSLSQHNYLRFPFSPPFGYDLTPRNDLLRNWNNLYLQLCSKFLHRRIYSLRSQCHRSRLALQIPCRGMFPPLWVGYVFGRGLRLGLYHLGWSGDIIDVDADVDHEIRSKSPGTISCEIGLKLGETRTVRGEKGG
jgi:hypothetical protein